ncbi:MAG TPA: PspC domain-containing protein [Acidimicrobiales bacterium]|nr:PspC domain-containing protein [Acidimicrobiales bacterium]
MAPRGSGCKDRAIAITTSHENGDAADDGAPSATATPRRPQRPLVRGADDAVLGGVCVGLARRFGVPVKPIRVLAVVSIAPAAIGLLAYTACWALVPRAGEDRSVASRVLADRREVQIVLAVSTVMLAVLITLVAIGVQGPGAFAWPLLLSTAGLLCVWRGASDDERERLQARLSTTPLVGAATATSWRTVLLRACIGGALVLIGVALLSKIGELRGAAIGVFIGIISVCAGFLMMFAPWWLRTLRDLANERRQRVRAQERADVAAHLHDSVLQTLLLIQKSASQPTEVVRLALNQERELRHWLFDPPRRHAHAGSATFSTLASDIERDVEDDYGIGVELIVVGDCEPDDALRALLAAGREAAVNAAKWSATTSISMFAEVEPDQVSLFVRDVGQGFDPDAVPADRKGIAHSIVERMARHGGLATIRSSPGAGTEVELVVPRHAAP